MTKQIARKLTIFSLVFALGLAPTLSYAHNDGDNDGDNNDHRDKQEQVEKSDKTCLRAFGHFFARGWLKKNRGEVDFSWNCFRPFKNKRFRGMATSTPDTIPPVINRINLLTATSTVNVTWHTNENASSRVYYSTSSSMDVNSSSTNFVENTSLLLNHIVSLTGLTSSTTYYLAAESKDSANNKTVTTIFSTTTH